MAPIGVIRKHWEATALSRRMVLLIVSIMAVALVAVGALMISLLQRHLVRQVDDQLTSSALRLADDVSTTSSFTKAQSYPTDYFIQRDLTGQPTVTILTSETENRAGRPDLSRLRGQDLPLSDDLISIPTTVPSTKTGASWRVVVVPMVSTADQTPAGTVVIGLPLVGVTETVLNTSLWFFLVGTGIVFVGGMTGFFLVRRSLQPLRQIESVAEKIAAGDLSRRIPPGAPGTEVGSLADSLNGMLSQIEVSFTARDESEQKVRRFVSDASHELRTPLAAIRGYGELYRMGGVPEERVGDVMGRIESESTRMGTLVEDLLVLARLDEKRPLNLTAVNLVPMAIDAASDLEALDPARPVKVQGLNSRKLPKQIMVKADRDQLTQVAVNLVGNIARYTPTSSPVEILVAEDDGWGIIEFRDHGPGIPPGEQELVFERFYRTDRSRARSLGGSGLGLSIVAGIVEAHSGIVKLSETKRGGLTVRVQLPLEQTGEHAHQ